MIEDYIFLKERGIFRSTTDRLKGFPLTLSQINEVITRVANCHRIGVKYDFAISAGWLVKTEDGKYEVPDYENYYVKFYTEDISEHVF